MQLSNLDNTNLIITRFREGDQEVFKLLYDRYHRILFATMLQYVGQREVAEDIVSNVFMKLYDRRATIRDFDHIYAFLYVAARNEAVDHLRHQKRTRLAHIDHEQLADREYRDPREPELETEEWMSRVLEAIELLPAAKKNIFHLHYFEGLSIREIATRLNLTETTVRNQRNRALIFLRQTFSL